MPAQQMHSTLPPRTIRHPNMQTTFAFSPAAAPRLLRPHSRPATLSLRRPPRAAKEPPAPPTSPPATPEETRGGLLAGLRLNPMLNPTLLRGPEAVGGVLAVAFAMAATFLVDARRRIMSDVAERARTILASRQLQMRVANRRHQRDYLDSAVRATRATLLNTESYLDAQIKRAKLAEARLEELRASRRDLDDAIESTRSKRDALVEVESALERERAKADTNEDLVKTLEENIALRKESLQTCDADAHLARQALQEAEDSAERSLESAVKDKNDLERALKQKRRQLDEEVAERNKYMETFSMAEKELESANHSFEKTISDLETRRERIERVSAEANALQEAATTKRASLDAVVEGEADAEQIEQSLDSIRGEQQSIRDSLDYMKSLEEQKAAEKVKLLESVAAREAELEQLQTRLAIIRQSNPVHQSLSTPEEAKDSKLELQKVSEDAKIDVLAATQLLETARAAVDEAEQSGELIAAEVESRSRTILEKSTKKKSAVQKRLSSNRARSRGKLVDEILQSTESNLHSSKESVNGDQEEADRLALVTSPSAVTQKAMESPPKRRTSGPSKTTAVLSDSSVTAARRGRGRPRKVVADVEDTGEVAPKRKRGRPRKHPLPPKKAE